MIVTIVTIVTIAMIAMIVMCPGISLEPKKGEGNASPAVPPSPQGRRSVLANLPPSPTTSIASDRRGTVGVCGHWEHGRNVKRYDMKGRLTG